MHQWQDLILKLTDLATHLRHASCFQIVVFLLLNSDFHLNPYFHTNCSTPSAAHVYPNQFGAISVDFTPDDLFLGLINIIDQTHYPTLYHQDPPSHHQQHILHTLKSPNYPCFFIY